MSAPPLRFWIRNCVMDDFDDAMLSFALRDEFPNVVFLKNSTMLRSKGIEAAETIPECDQALVDIWFPREGWEPLFFPHPDYPDKYDVINPPRLFLHYNRTRWFYGAPQGDRNWAFSLPMPEQGRITSGRWEWDKEQRQFRHKITKILGRLTTNRMKDWFQRDEYLSTKTSKRRNTWAGYSVLKWCAEEPNRAIHSMFRPPDDWEPKETAWHRGMKNRVVERFGGNYGGPREFVSRNEGLGKE